MDLFSPRNSDQISDFSFVSEFNGLPVESVDSEKQRPFCSERSAAQADDDGAPARGPGPEDGGSAQQRPVIGEVREEVRARAKTAWIELARRGREGGGSWEPWRRSLVALATFLFPICVHVFARTGQGHGCGACGTR